MTYQQTLDYLYQQLPMYQRIGNAAFKKSLHNTEVLVEALGQPHRKFASIHIAGTNGKGSSSHMLAAVLQAAGYKTGLYTSPHLKSFTERIKVNGLEVPEEYVVRFVEQNQRLFEAVQPSFFEMTVALAFRYFADEAVDVAVVEVGLGGRLDSTNIITPLVSLITNISLDHQDLLGKDLPSIAGEKAGIIKSRVPAVVGSTQAETTAVFKAKAAQEAAPLSFADQEYRVELQQAEPFRQIVNVYQNGSLFLPDLVLDLPGNYQRLNLPGVLKVAAVMQEKGFLVQENHLREGLGNVRQLTNLKGRWQVLHEQPLVVCDTGHNEDGLRQVMAQLTNLPYHQLHVVFGAVKEKDLGPIMKLLPKEAEYYFCQANIPRALPTEELVQVAREAGLKGNAFPTVEAAYTAARRQAQEEDVVFIGGSTFVVAELPDL